VVAIGPDQNAERFGPMPPNVRLEHYVPQPLLLPHCTLFITHAGFNSVKESLISGIPMVVIPITADQPYCADRCAALGVAQVITSKQRTPQAVRAATLQVLGDPAYRTNALEFQRQMLALPGYEHMIELLEGLLRQFASAHRHLQAALEIDHTALSNAVSRAVGSATIAL
jgi:MGT family glycosyltransferase